MDRMWMILKEKEGWGRALSPDPRPPWPQVRTYVCRTLQLLRGLNEVTLTAPRTATPNLFHPLAHKLLVLQHTKKCIFANLTKIGIILVDLQKLSPTLLAPK